MKKANFGYIGSKFSLLDFISSSIQKLIGDDFINKNITDIFAGTGIVGLYFKSLGANIISNDMEEYAHINNIITIKNGKQPRFKGIGGLEKAFEMINNAKPHKGFMHKEYSPSDRNEYNRTYFTVENAMKIDGIRKLIDEWFKKKKITKIEKFYLLVTLVTSVTRVSNTAAVYEAYLKQFKTAALKPIHLVPLEIIANHDKAVHSVYKEDANKLIKKISGDVLYMDPPYNTRQYSRNYHILTTIVQNDNPEIKGKTGQRIDNFISPWSQKTNATNALEDIVANANFKYVVLSYNDEGIIPISDIKRIFNKYGTYKVYKKRYKRFKAGMRKQIKDYTYEYLHCCVKGDKND